MYITLVVVSAGNIVVKEFLEEGWGKMEKPVVGIVLLTVAQSCVLLSRTKWKLTDGNMEGSWREGDHLTFVL